MKKSILIAVVIAVAAVLWILSGTLSAPSAPENEGARPAETAEKKTAEVRVRVLDASPMIGDVTVTGRSFASRVVTLRAEIEGQVTAILAEKGSKVEQGAALAKLDDLFVPKLPAGQRHLRFAGAAVW